MDRYQVFSIGHSDLSIDRFMSLLLDAGITAVADVRTSPKSGRSPWFNREQLQNDLARQGIEYRYLGKELGGRPTDHALYRDGVANYPAMAATRDFQVGIRRVLTGAKDHIIALMCSEKDPLHCHRCLLVARELKALGVEVIHLAHDGHQETQADVEQRLLREERMDTDEAFPLAYRIDRAFEIRNRRVAYTVASPNRAASKMDLLQ